MTYTFRHNPKKTQTSKFKPNPFKCKDCGHSIDVAPDANGCCRTINLMTGEVCGCKHK